MKKLLAVAVLGLLGTGAFAQTSQGTVAVGGSVNYHSFENTSNTNDTLRYNNNMRGFHISPSLGYFIKNNLELGVGLGYSQSSAKSKTREVETHSISNYISFNFYGRKYIPLTEQLHLHATGTTNIVLGNHKNNTATDAEAKVESTMNGFSIGAYPGLTYFATPKLGFTTSFGLLSYSRTKTKPKNEYSSSSTTHTFNADLSLSSVSIGFGYFIAR